MDLQTIIEEGDPREIRRAMSVRMVEEKMKPELISKLLGIGESFISKYKKIYSEQGC